MFSGNIALFITLIINVFFLSSFCADGVWELFFVHEKKIKNKKLKERNRKRIK